MRETESLIDGRLADASGGARSPWLAELAGWAIALLLAVSVPLLLWWPV